MHHQHVSVTVSHLTNISMMSWGQKKGKRKSMIYPHCWPHSIPEENSAAHVSISHNLILIWVSGSGGFKGESYTVVIIMVEVIPIVPGGSRCFQLEKLVACSFIPWEHGSLISRSDCVTLSHKAQPYQWNTCGSPVRVFGAGHLWKQFQLILITGSI